MASQEMLLSSPLGKKNFLPREYDPKLLYPIAREKNRKTLGLNSEHLIFHGVDIWDTYELIYCNQKGKPVVAVGQFEVPCQSENLFESKSLKLYLNSYANKKFASVNDFARSIKTDLSDACKQEVKVTVKQLNNLSLAENVLLQPLDYYCIDNVDIAISSHDHCPNPNYLKIKNSESLSEKLCSHIFKSNCPVTIQPDWASVFIEYKGKAIDHASLLHYIISYRESKEFHEHCTERMFVDIMKICQPEKLYISLQYTRRGGICITPMRSNYSCTFKPIRGLRQ